jgi:tRNA 5-methylaminomethyl-2-thiouridine biosynthesis bifunctional protein
MKIAIIGAGLAGCAAAHILKRYELDCIVYEAAPDIASNASGNPVGLVNPRFYAERNAESEYFARGFHRAVEEFDALALEENNPIGWQKCGALHLMNDEKKQKRFPQTFKNWGWSEKKMRLVNHEEASEIAGIKIGYDALYLPDSGYLNPKLLCERYVHDVDVRFKSRVTSLKDIQADIIILACANSANQFPETRFLRLQSVRGQITQLFETPLSKKLRCNIHYGGYCTPVSRGIQTIGATFQPWLNHSEVVPEDDQENIDALHAILPALATEPAIVAGNRAAVRCTSKDHLPIIGALPDYPKIYATLAHGSHGILSSLAAAQIIADTITGKKVPFSDQTLAAVSPARFT